MNFHYSSVTSGRVSIVENKVKKSFFLERVLRRCLPCLRSPRLSTRTSQRVASHSSAPVSPYFLARCRAIALLWDIGWPFVSRTGSWPYGIAVTWKKISATVFFFFFKPRDLKKSFSEMRRRTHFFYFVHIIQMKNPNKSFWEILKENREKIFEIKNE